MTTPVPTQDPPFANTTKSTRRRRNINRVFKKIKTVLGRGRTSRQSETSAPAATVVTSRPAATETAVIPTENQEPLLEIYPAADPFHTMSSVGAETLEVDRSATDTDALTAPDAALYIRGVMNRGRAKALFDKYGLPFEELDRPCSSDKDGVRRLRVEKPIRMRVRFACHNCSVVFGLSRICQNCEHVRCKECHRSPVRRAKEKSERKKLDKGKEPAQVESSVEGRSRGGFIQMPETTPSAADSQTMAQQIRTTCHRCEASFVPASAQICIACGHLKCSRCTNEWVVPQIEDGPTDVHVGDDSKQKRRRVYRKPRQRIRWYCHECQSIFIEGTKVCNECLHGRCEQCVRIPAKKKKSNPFDDAELAQTMQDCLARKEYAAGVESSTAPATTSTTSV